MTKEEILQIFTREGIVPRVYKFNGTQQQLAEVANTSYTVFAPQDDIYFISTDVNYIPTDHRIEVL